MLTSMASPARRGAVPALAGGLHPSVRFCQKTQETERWRPTIHAGLRPVSAGQQSSRKETAGRISGRPNSVPREVAGKSEKAAMPCPVNRHGNFGKRREETRSALTGKRMRRPVQTGDERERCGHRTSSIASSDGRSDTCSSLAGFLGDLEVFRVQVASGDDGFRQ